MSIEEIPADQVVTMTDFWHRAFIANGCKPCCHATGKWIEVGDKFQLLTVKSRTYRDGRHSYWYPDGQVENTEVMVSADADIKAFEESQYAESKLYAERKGQAKGGCYRINGKIVH